MKKVDFVIIGGGSAGYSAANAASACGLEVVVFDSAETLGGLCINKGCMPSKGLIAGANRVREARESGRFGYSTGEIAIDWEKFRTRKDVLIDDFQSYREDGLKSGDFELIRSAVCFTGPKQLVITGGERAGEELEFAYALIATGSEVAIPDIPGLDEIDYWTSDETLVMEELPKSVVILGAGIIGVECGHMMKALGVDVTIVQRSGRILTAFDEDAALEVQASTQEQGIDLLLETSMDQVRAGGDGVEWLSAGGWRTAEKLIIAIGRKPAVTGLELEKCGLQDPDKGLQVDENQCTSVANILAAGDVVKGSEILHRAVVDGERAGRYVAQSLGREAEPSRVVPQVPLVGVFSHPEIAQVGMMEAEAREQFAEVYVASHRFDDSGRGLLEATEHGLAKLIAVGPERRLVGAAISGPHACELIHEMVVAISLDARAEAVARMPHYHPTFSEIWTYPLEELAGW